MGALVITLAAWLAACAAVAWLLDAVLNFAALQLRDESGCDWTPFGDVPALPDDLKFLSHREER